MPLDEIIRFRQWSFVAIRNGVKGKIVVSIVANVDLEAVLLVVDKLWQVDTVHLLVKSRCVLSRHELGRVELLRWEIDLQGPIRIAVNSFIAVSHVPSRYRRDMI